MRRLLEKGRVLWAWVVLGGEAEIVDAAVLPPRVSPATVVLDKWRYSERIVQAVWMHLAGQRMELTLRVAAATDDDAVELMVEHLTERELMEVPPDEIIVWGERRRLGLAE